MQASVTLRSLNRTYKLPTARNTEPFGQAKQSSFQHRPKDGLDGKGQHQSSRDLETTKTTGWKTAFSELSNFGPVPHLCPPRPTSGVEAFHELLVSAEQRRMRAVPPQSSH